MAAWSQVRLSAFASGLRCDPEYYQPKYLADAKTLNLAKPVRLDSIAVLTDGIHASPDKVEDGGVLYLSAKCVKDNAFALGDALRISDAQHSQNPRTSLTDRDVLLTTVGTIGNAAVVQPELLPANADRHLGIIRLHKSAPIDPYYLATFLNCEFGRFQSMREATGNVQLNLFIEKLRELQIPLLDCASRVSRQTRSAYEKRREALGAISKAKQRLTKILKLDALDGPEHRIATATFSSMAAADRFDAEYFCTGGLRHWKSPFETLPLSDSRITKRLANGVTPAATDYADEGYPIIKVGDVEADARAIWGGERVRSDAPAALSPRGELKPGDVVVLCAAHHIRYIGKAGLFEGIPGYPGPVRSVGELITVRAATGLSPAVLCLYLNLKAVKSESQRHVRGLSAHLYPSDFGDLPVPLLPRRVQEELEELVEASSAAYRAAESLIDRAKRLVEDEIRSASGITRG